MADAEAGPYDAEDAAAMPAPPSGKSHETDFVVIGSGLGGLSAGAMLAKYGYKVTMCEAHYLPGGCAHGFEIKSKKDGGIYKFDAGPSLWAGMSQPSTNPLRQVMDAVGASVEWKQYTGWGVYFPDGYFRFNVGPANIPGGFEEVLQRFGAPGGGLKEWRTLIEKIKPLILSCTTFPPIALRADPGVLVTLRKQLPTFLSFGPVAAKINGPFSAAMQEAGIKDGTFLSHWLDYLSFALSGLLADGTICAAVSYTLGDLHRKGAVLDYPVGGSAAVCESLVESMENNGGTLMLRTPVEKILIENGKACGVVTKNGDTIRARKGVVSNVPIWGLGKLLPQEFVTKSWGGLIENSWKTQDTVKKFDATPQTESFMHLHLGIDAKGLKGLDIHYTVINDWEPGIDAAGNMIVISIPTVLDPSLAPDGKHVVHAYTAGNEPYSLFKGIDRKSDKYEELKRQRAQVLFEAVKRVIPDLDQRIEVELIGSPLTHERFLRRPQGTYGPAWAAGKDMFPGPGVASIPGLLCCGDSTFPGIGVPAVAASGLMAANTLVPLSQHLDLLERMKKEGLMPDQCMV
ncbi:phytoene dehydrogenase family protein [Baffinella frigidus]|nr:phytoene dehydrogenase family protein [Cryptophyta sp. CCMP2293]